MADEISAPIEDPLQDLFQPSAEFVDVEEEKRPIVDDLVDEPLLEEDDEGEVSARTDRDEDRSRKKRGGRRRRRRGRDQSEDREREDVRNDAEDHEASPSDDFMDDLGFEDLDDADPVDEDDDQTSRSRREPDDERDRERGGGRRRRRKRRSRRDGGGERAVESDRAGKHDESDREDYPDEGDEEIEGRPRSGRTRERSSRDRDSVERDRRPADDGEGRRKSRPNIPSWSDAIENMIAHNIANHKKSRGGPGRGRRRRRD